MTKIIIVDENDNEIGLKERGTLNPEDIYRVSALWITNSNGEVLLAQRNFNKKHDSGKWGPAVAGTVDDGETYDSNIIKEAEEELGLKNINFKKGIKKERFSNKHKYFGQWYFLIIDRLASEFIIQKEEVEKVQWFSKDEFYNLYLKNPSIFLDSIKKWFDEF
ncbi:hypothetical protein COV23_02400 [Candidatus Wolfebacteria bacterium CG10_big_fil_rev_8_21_14_0_10_31_9]|uniref:Nudix hydrolase domain-containing protein n=1 Tax=Candidatus Wolfebacteria bacterium CG10_big_fil_rev_8_21_14_0_10_31_9 TaxID=1975070 RepID=A0A2H0RBQ6_9BACT|nr:MAG: hypothetical protein COV23_02400 [Candidatus Wolfebacteria bacterium CG10_big_fil_rev_8_21_14_0_10_31_9]